MINWLKDNGLWIALIVFIGLYINSYTAGKAAEQIAWSKQQALDYKADYDNLMNLKIESDKQVAAKNVEIVALEKRELEIVAERDSIKIELIQLQDKIVNDVMNIKSIDGSHALAESLSEAYPRLKGASGYGVTDFYDPVEETTLPYMVIPLRFTQVFVIERAELLNARKQIGKLDALDSLAEENNGLKSRITGLEREKLALREQLADQCTASYELGLGRFDEINDALQQCLGKARIDLGGFLPWVGGALIGGGACGAVLNYTR